ncbi:MAG: cadherin-like domain-containing protein, partial [Ilumatobacter sp.]|nr:cadherin-like domain-containing protein [Ilumatobacter sp.]
DPTPAFAESGLVTGYAWIECADPGASETAGADLTPILPPTGTLLHMSTGIAVDGVPGDTANDALGTSFRGAFDVSVLRLDVDIPAPGAGEAPLDCLAFDVVFASEEFPDFVNKPYNDGFLAELDTSTWTVSGATIDAPDNFAFDPDGNYLSVKGAFFDPGRVITDTGMVYNGATPVLRVFTPITTGAHSVYLSVFDGADAFENSGALIENLEAFSSTACVPGASQPPVADDDSFTIDEDVPTVLDVLANDSDPDGDDITILSATAIDPAGASIVVSADRTTLTFEGPNNFYGPATFEYTITDRPNSEEGEPVAPESHATVTIDVIEVNDPPDAWSDGATAPMDTPTVIPVLANDFDRDFSSVSPPDGIRIDSWTQPEPGGSVTCTDTDCTYTPPPGYDGPARFTYTIVDFRPLGAPPDPALAPRGATDTTTVFINTPVFECDPLTQDCVPPIADAGGPYEAIACPVGPCSDQLFLDGTGSSDDSGVIAEWQWYVAPSPPASLIGATGPTPEFVTTQNGSFRVWLIVYDEAGNWDWDTATVSAFAAEVTSPIPEGGTATVTVDFFNPGGDLTTTVDWGDGLAPDVSPFSIFPVAVARDFPQDGTFAVEVCITGTTTDGPVDLCDTQQLVVDNVLPVVDAGIDRNLVSGGTLVQSRMSFFDPGDDAPWTATVDWGDGSAVEPLIVNQATGELTMSAGHQYPVNGTYTVTICVQDDDGAGCDTFDVSVSDNAPPVADPG